MVALELLLSLKLKDEHGKIVRKELRESHSFLIHYLQHLWAGLREVDYVVKDWTGVNRTISHPKAHAYYFFHMSAGEGETDEHIVVGTGNTTPTITDYALESQIAHGNGVGQLFHFEGEYNQAPTVVDGAAEMRVRRLFSNLSGAAITVNEVGIYVLTQDNAGVLRNFCFIRDVVRDSWTLQPRETLELEYIMRIAV